MTLTVSLGRREEAAGRVEEIDEGAPRSLRAQDDPLPKLPTSCWPEEHADMLRQIGLDGRGASKAEVAAQIGA